MKGYTDTTKMRPVHDLSVKGPVGGVKDFHPYGPDHGLMRRETPMTEELKEAGGTSPLRSGFAKGGPTHKHFHVHHHHHAEGGEVKTASKSYKHVERKAARLVERVGPDKRPHVKDSTRTPRDRYGEGGAVTEAQLDHSIGMKRGGKWMKDAVKRPGAFRAKAERAGMSTAAYASKVTKPGSEASTRTKRQANLSKTFAKVRPKSAGGAVYARGGSTTGGTRNRLAVGGMPMRGGRPMRPPVAPGPTSSGFLPSAAPPVTGGPVMPTLQRLGPGPSFPPPGAAGPTAPGPAMRRPMPVLGGRPVLGMRARGGHVR